MRYKVKFKAGFSEESFCYFCYSEGSSSVALYEAAMTGHEKITDKYSMEREGYYIYLLNFTLGGRGAMTYGGREYALETGDLLFINCAEKHAFSSAEGNWEFVYIHVNGLGIRSLYDRFCSAFGNVCHGYTGKYFCASLARLQALLATFPQKRQEKSINVYLNETRACDVSEIVYGILMDTARAVAQNNSEKPYALTLALDYIQKNFQRNLSLEEIAQKAYLSKYHFERVFTENMGETVHRYISDLRLNRAMWLLKTTEKPIADVAAEVGYSDAQALTKLFKKSLGQTPAAYRKNGDPY